MIPSSDCPGSSRQFAGPQLSGTRTESVRFHDESKLHCSRAPKLHLINWINFRKNSQDFLHLWVFIPCSYCSGLSTGGRSPFGPRAGLSQSQDISLYTGVHANGGPEAIAKGLGSAMLCSVCRSRFSGSQLADALKRMERTRVRVTHSTSSWLILSLRVCHSVDCACDSNFFPSCYPCAVDVRLKEHLGSSTFLRHRQCSSDFIPDVVNRGGSWWTREQKHSKVNKG